MERFIKLAAGAAVALCLLWLVPVGARASQEQEIYEKSGAGKILESLDKETQDLLSQAGAGQALWEGGDGGALFQAASRLAREKLTAPARGLAALAAILVLSRVASLFEEGEQAVTLAATLCCAAVLTPPLLDLLQAIRDTLDGASALLGASVPVFAGLMAASGSGGAGAAYSALALAAGAALPAISTALVLPLLRAFLLLALSSPLCRSSLDGLVAGLYGFAKWALVLAATLFSGLLSAQTLLGAQADAATGKAVKFLASSAIPIVGSAFGDAVAALQGSLAVVKSGVGAFGILAALCVFLPTVLQACMWLGVCLLAQTAATLLEVPRLGALFGACCAVAKMALAVLCSVCAVTVVCAALVLFAKGNLS